MRCLSIRCTSHDKRIHAENSFRAEKVHSWPVCRQSIRAEDPATVGAQLVVSSSLAGAPTWRSRSVDRSKSPDRLNSKSTVFSPTIIARRPQLGSNNTKLSTSRPIGCGDAAVFHRDAAGEDAKRMVVVLARIADEALAVTLSKHFARGKVLQTQCHHELLFGGRADRHRLCRPTGEQ